MCGSAVCLQPVQCLRLVLYAASPRPSQLGQAPRTGSGAVAFFCFIYGFTEGFPKMQVKRITIYVPNLPKSFEGYRIVQFSDIHLGSYYGWRGHLPQRDIDSINAENLI